jgi:hypothetical protein
MKRLMLKLLTVASLGLVLTACGQPEIPAEQTAGTPADVNAAPEATSLPRSPAPEGASVAILQPHDGDVVSSPVTVTFDVQGMALAQAGDAAPNTGHHHLLVDTPTPDLGQAIPKDAQHLHFGQAQTTAEITLAPGQHTLQLLLGDSNHVPHNPPVFSPPITITVQ